ncbi:MAG: hypothetical protein ACOCNL_14185 [Acetivibrio ethanolgignens]
MINPKNALVLEKEFLYSENLKIYTMSAYITFDYSDTIVVSFYLEDSTEGDGLRYEYNKIVLNPEETILTRDNFDDLHQLVKTVEKTMYENVSHGINRFEEILANGITKN